MAMLKPGDYVRPIVKIDGADVGSVMTECQVVNVYKNGNIFATSDDGSVTHHGPASGFQKIRSNA